MKNRKYLVGLVVLPFLAFCTKDDVADPSFDVTVEKREYKVNEFIKKRLMLFYHLQEANKITPVYSVKAAIKKLLICHYNNRLI